MGDRISKLRRQFACELYAEFLDARLTDLREGAASVQARVQRDDLTVHKTAHGGFLAAVVDFAGAYAAMSMVPSGRMVAQSIRIDFLRPALEGEEIIASAKVFNVSKSLTHVQVYVFGASEKVKAHAICVFAKPAR